MKNPRNSYEKRKDLLTRLSCGLISVQDAIKEAGAEAEDILTMAKKRIEKKLDQPKSSKEIQKLERLFEDIDNRLTSLNTSNANPSSSSLNLPKKPVSKKISLIQRIFNFFF
jgi:hypothetical protein